MGRTGAGKTTLLRLLLGLVTPVEGAIRLYSGGSSYVVSETTALQLRLRPAGRLALQRDDP